MVNILSLELLIDGVPNFQAVASASPRVFDPPTADKFTDLNRETKQVLQLINDPDIIPTVPWAISGDNKYKGLNRQTS